MPTILNTPRPPGADIRMASMNAVLAANWWSVLARGLFAILFGVVSVALPGVTLSSLVILLAAYLLVDGVFAIVGAVRAAERHERWGAFVIEGVVDLIAAVAFVAYPGLTIVFFVTLIAVWALVSGVFMLIAAFRLGLDHGRWWLVLSGAVSVLFGVSLFVAPVTGAVVLAIWLGAYAIVFGATLVVVALRLRARRPAGGPIPLA